MHSRVAHGPRRIGNCIRELVRGRCRVLHAALNERVRFGRCGYSTVCVSRRPFGICICICISVMHSPIAAAATAPCAVVFCFNVLFERSLQPWVVVRA